MAMEFEHEEIEEMMNVQETEQSEPVKQEKPVQGPQKVRRVGTFTMGCVMIFAGVALMTTILSRNWNIAWAMFRFAPLVLVALGAEVLVASFKSGTKLKYDVISVFICGFLVLVIGGTSLFPQLFFEYAPKRMELQTKMEKEIYETVYNTVGTDGIDNLYVNCSLNRLDFSASEKELRENSWTYLNFRLNQEYADVDKMAEKVYQINQRIENIFGIENAARVEARYSVINAEHQEQTIQISGLYGLDLSQETIKRQIENSFYQYEQQDYSNALNAQMEQERQSYEDRISALQLQLEETISEMNAQAEQQRISYEDTIAELQQHIADLAG